MPRHRVVSYPAYTDGGGVTRPAYQIRIDLTEAEEDELSADEARVTEEMEVEMVAREKAERVKKQVWAKVQATVGLTDEELAVIAPEVSA